jgi:hypothetical protein
MWDKINCTSGSDVGFSTAFRMEHLSIVDEYRDDGEVVGVLPYNPESGIRNPPL